MSKKNGGGQKDLLDGYDSAFDPPFEGGQQVKSGFSQYTPKCYESHPVIQFANATGTLCGGSCSNPIHADADVYVGLDSYMKFRKTTYPWQEQTPGPIEFLFGIQDGNAPKDEDGFVAMIGWLATQLMDGKKVHVGCIGGHGRTGMVLAALVNQIDGIEDAITHVRKIYCKKAVESTVQVKFLNARFGITIVEGSKSHGSTFGGEQKKGGGGGKKNNQGTGKVSTYQGTQQLPDYSDRWEKFIPGTTVERAKGPRDLKPPTKTAVDSSGNKVEVIVPGSPIKPPKTQPHGTLYAEALPQGPNSMWGQQ